MNKNNKNMTINSTSSNFNWKDSLVNIIENQ